MNADAVRRNCVKQARLQFQIYCREVDTKHSKPRYRITDIPLPLIISSGCCAHNVLYQLPCKKCGRKATEV